MAVEKIISFVFQFSWKKSLKRVRKEVKITKQVKPIFLVDTKNQPAQQAIATILLFLVSFSYAPLQFVVTFMSKDWMASERYEEN